MTEISLIKDIGPIVPEAYRKNERYYSTKVPPINIGNRDFERRTRILSNFARTEFTLDGIKYASVEAFIQSMKSPHEEERERIRPLVGIEAKIAGKKFKAEIEQAFSSKKPYLITYQNEQIPLWSDKWYDLVERALAAKFEQNPETKKILVGGRRFNERNEITHILYNREGRPISENPATSLPAEVFTTILMKIRHEAQISFLQKLAEGRGDIDYELNRFFNHSLDNPDIILAQRLGYKIEMQHWLQSLLPKEMQYGTATEQERMQKAREYKDKAGLSEEEFMDEVARIGL